MAVLKHNVSKFNSFAEANAATNLIAPHVSLINSTLYYSKNIEFGKDVSFDKVDNVVSLKELKNYKVSTSGDSTCTINLENTSNPSRNAAPKETIKFTLKLTSGYQVKTLSCKTTSGREIRIDSVPNSTGTDPKYQFSMPFENCTISVTSTYIPVVNPTYTLTFDLIDPYRDYTYCDAVKGYMTVDGGDTFSIEKSSSVSIIYEKLSKDADVIRTFGRTLIFINADTTHTQNTKYTTPVEIYYLGTKFVLTNTLFETLVSRTLDGNSFSIPDGCFSALIKDGDINFEPLTDLKIRIEENRMYIESTYVGSLYFWRNYHMNDDITFTGFVLELPEAEEIAKYKQYEFDYFDLTFRSEQFENSFIIEPSLRPHVSNMYSIECEFNSTGDCLNQKNNGFGFNTEYYENPDKYYYIRYNNIVNPKNLQLRFNMDHALYGRYTDTKNYKGDFNKLIFEISFTGDKRIDNIIKEEVIKHISSGNIDEILDFIREHIEVFIAQYKDNYGEAYFERYPNMFINEDDIIGSVYKFINLSVAFNSDNPKEFGPSNTFEAACIEYWESMNNNVPQSEFMQKMYESGWDNEKMPNIFDFTAVDYKAIERFCRWTPLVMTLGTLSLDYCKPMLEKYGSGIEDLFDGRFNLGMYRIGDAILPEMKPYINGWNM